MVRTLKNLVGALVGASALGWAPALHGRSRHWPRLLVARPWAVLAAVALITALACGSALSTRVDSSTEMWFLDGDPALADYRGFTRQFGSEEAIVVGVVARDGKDVFETSALAVIEDLSAALESAPWVSDVASLTRTDTIGSDAEGIVIAPATTGSRSLGAGTLRERVLTDPLLVGSLVSPDGRLATVVGRLDPAGANLEGKSALRAEAELIVARTEAATGHRLLLGGTPVMEPTINLQAQSDIVRSVPLIFALLVLAIYAVFRRLLVVALTLSIVGIALAWTLGLMAAFESPLNLVSSALIGLIVAVGIADPVHFYSEFESRARAYEGHFDAIRQSLRAMIVPCAFTSLTTIAGLLAFSGSDLGPVREFGFAAAFGVAVALLVTLTALPAALSVLPRRFSVPSSSSLKSIDGLLVAAADFAIRRRGVLVGSAGAVLVGAAIAWSTLEVAVNPLTFLPPSSPLRQATVVLDEGLGGTTTLEIVAETSAGEALSPRAVDVVARIESWLARQPGVGFVRSALVTLRSLNSAVTGVAGASLPTSPEGLAQLLVLIEGESLDAFVDPGRSSVRISAPVQLTGSGTVHEWRHELDTFLDGLVGDDVQAIVVTGYVHLISKMEEYLISSQLSSAAIALVVITIMMTIVLRSPRLGLLSLVPNVLPVAGAIGAMGLLGIPLDPGTVMVSAIALGIVVDDTVHFLVRYQRLRAAGEDVDAAIRETVLESGRPIVVTSLVLSASFAVLVVADFSPTVHFGAVLAVTVLMALPADLVLLPAVLALVDGAKPEAARGVSR